MPPSLLESLERHRPLSGPGLIKDRLNLLAVICQELFEGESRHCARARRRAAWTVRARLARFLPSLLPGISILGFRVTESIHRTTIQRAGPAWLGSYRLQPFTNAGRILLWKTSLFKRRMNSPPMLAGRWNKFWAAPLSTTKR